MNRPLSFLEIQDGEVIEHAVHPVGFYKTPHNYDRARESERCGEFNDLPSLTVQSMSEDADLNVLMARQGLLNPMPENSRVPEYGDYTGITDYQSALNAVVAGQQAFMELPANVRGYFENDPQKYLVFASDPANFDKMVGFGLAKKTETPVVLPTKVEIVNPAPSAPLKQE